MNEVLSDWKVSLLNTYTRGKAKAMGRVNCSDRQKISKWRQTESSLRMYCMLSTVIIYVLSPAYNQGVIYEGTLFPL